MVRALIFLAYFSENSFSPMKGRMNMKSNNKWRIGPTYLILGVAIVISFVAVRATKAADEPIHLVTDWSHHHLVFSPPHNLMDRLRLSRNPRYMQQIIRRAAEREDQGNDGRWPRGPDDADLLHGDWSIDMGAGATVGAGNYPAKFSFNAGTASCTDFVVYNTSLAGSATQASVVAFNNLYVASSGGLCGTAPSTYWAFNTGGTVVTSVTLSLDGSQVAFVQNNSAGNAATLVLLKWAAGSGTIASPVTPTTASAALYPTCSAPCMTTIAFSLDAGGSTLGDALSSPFYDYTGDTLYVGDGFGYLHKFTSVFNGSASSPPAETVSTGANIWPALTSNNSPLTNPVYDQNTGWVFVGSLFGTLKRVNAVVGGGAGNPIIKTDAIESEDVNYDGPLLDSTNGVLYLIVSLSTLLPGQTSGASAVYTFPVNFAGGANGVQTVLTTAGADTAIYSGAFDNQWFLGNAGNMYVCAGGSGINSSLPTLYQIPVSATGVLGTVSTGPTLATSISGPPLCSPVTEFFNSSNTSGGTHPAGTDLIFLSVTNFGRQVPPIGCTLNTGCLMSFDVTSGASITSSTATVAARNEAGGTSGLIVDGSSASSGASQVYFNPLGATTCITSGGSGGCAVQVSQSGLN
jgi:hypothetical protein